MRIQRAERHELEHVLGGVGDGGRAAEELRAAAVIQAYAQQPTQDASHVRTERASACDNVAADIVRMVERIICKCSIEQQESI
jgi:hypothetical protein